MRLQLLVFLLPFVVNAAEPATSEISTNADLVDQPASVPKSPEVEASSQPQTDPAQLITVSDPNPAPQSQPQLRALAYQGDHNQLPSYKYPIFFRKPNLKDYVCNEYENIFHSVVNQCDHFIECKNREAMEFICPDGLYFNPKAEWREYPCADPALVVCRNETVTTPPPPIEVPQPLPQYKCPDANNYYAIEDQCNSFIECKQFSAMKFSCPDNLLFDREAKWPGYPCNNASQVRCGQPTPVPTPPTPPIVDPLPQTTARTTYLPVTTPNTPKPYPPQPITGLPPTRPPPPIPNPSTTEFVPTPEPGKNEWGVPKYDYICYEKNKYYPLPNDCNSFIECKNSEAMEFICPDGLYFNPEAEWREYPCADPVLVVCHNETVTIPPPPIEVPQPLPQYKCPDANNYYAIEDQCNSFIECKQFSAMKFSCPDNLLFDREAKWPGYPCNNASQVRCGQPTPVPTPPTPPIVDPLPQTTARTTHLPFTTPNTPRPYPPQPTTGLPPTRTPPPTPIPNPPTPKFVPTPEPGKNEWVDSKHDYICYEENKYYPLPNDCNSFIECKQFVPKKYTCPDGLQFNPRAIWLRYPCAEPAEVQCRIPIQATTTVVPDVEPDIISNYTCADKNRYYSANLDNESFIECKDYVAHGWKCPDGLQFNVNARYPAYPCVPPSLAKFGKRKFFASFAFFQLI